MKSMEEYINNVYEKYEEAEKKHQVYKPVRMKAYNPLNGIYGITACLALVVAFCIGINYMNVKDKEKENELKYVSSEVANNGTVIFTKYISIDGIVSDALKKMIKKSDIITVVSSHNVQSYGYEVKTGLLMLKEFGTLEIEKVIKGNIYNENNINYSSYGGKVSLNELEKNSSYDWKEWEMVTFGHEIPEEEKATTYYQQLPTKGCDFEEGKQYLVFMNYNEENEIYEIADIAYGIMEYDPDTNMVKNIDTGEFEEFDWSLIK